MVDNNSVKTRQVILLETKVTIIALQAKHPAATHQAIAEKFEMKCKTITDILTRRKSSLKCQKVEADGGNMERIKKFRGPLHDEVGAIFAVPFSPSK